jgi:hypothetical protein
LREFKSFSLTEVIIGVSLITLVFLAFGEVKITYSNKLGETSIKEEEVRLASSLIDVISTFSADSEIFSRFDFSNNSPISNLQGDGFSAFTTVDNFTSQYSIPLSTDFTKKNYWVMCSKSTLQYETNDFLYLRIYIFRKYKEKWVITEVGKVIK